jgi:hypothetical protein
MTIEITSPDVEALIRQRMEAGLFKTPEDLIREVLKSPLGIGRLAHLTCPGIDSLRGYTRGLRLPGPPGCGPSRKNVDGILKSAFRPPPRGAAEAGVVGLEYE